MPGISAPHRLTAADCDRAATWGKQLDFKNENDLALIRKFTELGRLIRVKTYTPVERKK